MKRYLLIINEYYYPGFGTTDWCGFFDTEDDANRHIDIMYGMYVDEQTSIGCTPPSKEDWLRHRRCHVVDILFEMDKPPKGEL